MSINQPSKSSFKLKTSSQSTKTQTKPNQKMPKNIHKSFHVYLNKLKKPSSSRHLNTVLSGCKHSKTISFAIEKDDQELGCGHSSHGHSSARVDEAATLSDIDRFLFENFNSLYRDEMIDDMKKKKKNVHENEDNSNGFLFESPRLLEEPPEIRPSNRFFVSTGTSSSLVEETQFSDSIFEEIGSSSTPRESIRESTEIKGVNLPEDSIAVLTSSPNPYEDFRGSMEEMVQVRLSQKQTVDWDFMEELLFCYLRLNDKKSYKYILGAFVDLVVNLRQNSEPKIPTTTTGERRRRRRKKVDITSDSSK